MQPKLDFPDGKRRGTISMLLWALGIIVLLAMVAGPARAQQAQSAWQLQTTWDALVTPYLWMPWTDVGVKPSNPKLSSASGTVGFDQLAKHLSWVPFMGTVEFRDGLYGVAFDYVHAPLRSGINTRNIVFSGGTGGATIDTGTAMFLYRPLIDPDQYIDVGLGVRMWGFDGDISLNQGLLGPRSVSSGGAWADPLVALRYHRNLGNGFSATAYGDVGGFGLGAHVDWQVLATIDYAMKSWMDLHAGFRSLNFTYGAPSAGIDVNMYGPILSATLRF